MDATRTVVGILCVFVGIAFVLLWPGRPRQYEYAAFGIFALCIAIHVFHATYVKLLVIQDSLIWIYLWILGDVLTPVAVVAFVERIFGSGYFGSVRWMLRFQALVSPLLLLAAFGWPGLLGNAVAITIRVSYFIYIVVVVADLFSPAARGDVDARTFLAGFLVLLATAVYDALQGLGAVARQRTVSFVGMAIFVMCLGAILVRRIVQMYRDIREYASRLERLSEEKSSMINELHDGLGGIMTNISMLAGVAGREGESRRSQALSTIQTLARTGIGEIRAFMRSLSVREPDRHSVAVEFRHYGASVLSPHGMRFELHAHIGDAVPPPDSHLHLNLNHIYRETLTNVVKHVGATEVAAALIVHDDGVVFEVRDDGNSQVRDPGAPADGTGSVGHGSSSMQTRAQSVGGRLSRRFDGGCTVRLEVPASTLMARGARPGAPTPKLPGPGDGKEEGRRRGWHYAGRGRPTRTNGKEG